MARSLLFSILAGLVVVLTTGCTTQSAAFPGRSPEQVWTALVTVSEEPQYDNWVLIENNVWVDSNYDRVEIYRRLRREVHRIESPTIREDELLELQFVLERTEPPVVTGVVRNPMVRGKGLLALEHIFGEMRKVLNPVTLDGVAASSDSSGDD